MTTISNDAEMTTLGPESGAEDAPHETAAQILDAARELVAQRGVRGTLVEDIAQAAGVAMGLVNYHYGSKAYLVEQIMQADADERLEQLQAHVGSAATLDELLVALQRTLGSLLASDGGMQAMHEIATMALRNEDLAARLSAARERYREVLGALLAEHAERGIVQLRAEPEVVASVLVAIAQGLLSERLADPEWDIQAAAPYALSVVRDMLAPAA